MDVRRALEKVGRWCAEQTAVGDPEALEVRCHGVVTITIVEAAPPWHVRWRLGSTCGASAPRAQLRYDIERREWALHHPELPDGWCSDDDALHGRTLGPLLKAIANDSEGRFEGLPPGFRWPFMDPRTRRGP